MIDRYSIAATADQLKSRFKAENTEPHQPRYNAAPGHLLPIILQHSPEGMSYFYWGAPLQQGKNRSMGEKIINLRAEQIIEKPVFQKKLRHYRCLVPADGFFAWRHIGKKTTTPYRFVFPEKSILSMAGIWEEYQENEEDHVHTFMIITTLANNHLSPIIDRMPALLDEATEKIWMNKESTTEELLEVLKPLNVPMEHFTVSHRITSPEINEASLLLPAPASNQFGNLTLFD
jgi:putative SOS response-associated peptidase YedK